jgi:hypothetical protein
MKTKKQIKESVWMVPKSIKFDPEKLKKAKQMGVIHLLAHKSREILDLLISDKQKK